MGSLPNSFRSIMNTIRFALIKRSIRPSKSPRIIDWHIVFFRTFRPIWSFRFQRMQYITRKPPFVRDRKWNWPMSIDVGGRSVQIPHKGTKRDPLSDILWTCIIYIILYISINAVSHRLCRNERRCRFGERPHGKSFHLSVSSAYHTHPPNMEI